MAIRFLMDANMSPETAEFLRSLGYEVKSLIEENLGHLSDEEVSKLAEQEKRIITTFDLDFGEIYYFSSPRTMSVILLRLKDQRVETTNTILRRFLGAFADELAAEKPQLFIVDETSVRISD